VANPEDIKTIKKLVYIHNMDEEWEKEIKLMAFT
jgi:hypothetical protein